MHAGRPDTPRRLLIVDDHPVIRSGLRTLIDEACDLEVSGEADTPDGALQALEEDRPDAAIVDLALGGSSGLELIEEMQARWPDVPVVVFSIRDESFYAERSIRAGARGYVHKAADPSQLIEALRKVLDGGVFVSDDVARRMTSRVASGAAGGQGSLDGLSEREREVFDLLGRGLTTRAIAGRLGISPKTVESHREHIKRKLHLDSGNELLRHAIEWGQHRARP